MKNKHYSIRSFGFRGLSGQINRIEDGFRSLGHLVNKMDSYPDLIYANDIGHWDKALDCYTASKIDREFNDHSQFANSKCILTILDLPFHLPQACRDQIDEVNMVVKNYPDIEICTISHKVAQNINQHCGFYPSVIYQPIKGITNLGIPWHERKIEYLIVGRNTDKQKGHYDVTIPCVKKMHGELSPLCTIGEGFVGAQNYGNVTDEQLNTAYNNAKYVFVCGTHDGLGMQLIESQAAGAIPISYHWHPTAKEFIPKELVFDSIEDIIEFIQTNIRPFDFDQDYINRFRKEQIAKNIINVSENSN